MSEFKHAPRPSADGDVSRPADGASQALGQRFHCGDQDSFREALRDLCPRVARWLRRKYGGLLQKRDCEDIAAEALEDAFECCAQYQPDQGPLLPWLVTIADHLAAHSLRGKRRSGGRCPHGEPPPREIATEPERLAEVRDPHALDPAALDISDEPNRAETLRALVHAGLDATGAKYRDVVWAWACSADGTLHADDLAAENHVTRSAIYKRLERGMSLLAAELRRRGAEISLSCPHSALSPYSGEEKAQTENGERRTENGERRTENGERRTENGERRTENDYNGRSLPSPSERTSRRFPINQVGHAAWSGSVMRAAGREAHVCSGSFGSVKIAWAEYRRLGKR